MGSLFDSIKVSEVSAFEFLPFFRALRNGTVERFFGTDVHPTGIDSESGVSSKDVVIVPETGVSARLFLPKSLQPGKKLPLLVYFHGGAFCFGSPFCFIYHRFLTTLVAQSNVVAVSVDYRLAPENPLPTAYEDSWDVLKWVSSHSQGHGQESWINDHADFERVFLAGDSAGANITHNTAIQAGVEGLPGMKISRICLIHPDFARSDGKIHESWVFACPDTIGWNDPRINPSKDTRLPKLGCSKVLVCVAEKDGMKDMGCFYYKTLKSCEDWGGAVELMETPGEDHVFHLFNPGCEHALELLKKVASFMS